MSAPTLPAPAEARQKFQEDLDATRAASEPRGGLLPADVSALSLRWLGKKQGLITALLSRLKEVPKEEKAAFGAAVNALKKEIEETLEGLLEKAEARAARLAEAARAVDVTLPPRRPQLGRLHPLTVVRRRIESAFRALGYEIADGPEIETDWYNFEALNFPPDHPARDSVDTFFVQGGAGGRDQLLLRTHTSPVQIRSMERKKPPIRILIPGRVYRKDDIDPRHSPVFHQVEGLVIDEGITFSDLRGTLAAFARSFFSERAEVRLAPTFFPFVEPGVDVAVSCVFCEKKGCRICSFSGWIEIMGAGMVHPNVLQNGGIDPDRFTGFAFGMGIDRIAMLLYGIPDLRLLFENDIRFLDRVWN
ncbi:MAG: phenylalanine--tRNA ligase subunit alpha [Thermoanaerobaculia bacterium]|nr:Phenylalanine--tRNA ligase alpha subunit [Thermoanaerobaculia bacterium]MCK6682497.1 phenylalanine--tRNA ligase subunit alpha [Thermoanaerobaculia bacterium]